MAAVEREAAELIALEKVIEDVGPEHHGRRHGDADVAKSLRHPRPVEQEVDEGQAPRLAAERSAANAAEWRRRTERRSIEVDDDAALGLLAVVADRAQHLEAEVRDRVEVGNLARPQLVRERELRSRLEPPRKMIALRVIGDALGRQRGQAVFQLTEVARAADLAAIRHAEDEIAEPEMLHHEATQLLQERRRVLDEKGRADGARQRLILDAARLQHHRHVGLAYTDTLREIETGIAGNLPVTGKFDVRNHAQNVLFVIDEVLPGLLVRPAQQDLRLRLHPHQLVREIHALRHQAVGVVHQLGVNGRQERRVVADVVFDDQNGLHTELARIVHDIPPSLDVLDDSGDQTDVALPQEHAIEWRRPAWLEQLRDFTHVVGEDDDGGVDARLAHA